MLSSLLFTCLLAPAPTPNAVSVRTQAGGADLKIVAQGDWPHVAVVTQGAFGKGRQLLVLRSAKELAQAAGERVLPVLAQHLGLAAADFDKHMLIVVADFSQPMVGVSGGGPPSALFRTEIQQVQVDAAGKVLTVYWRFVPRGPMDAIISAPVAVALVPKFEGEVNFVRLQTPGGKGPPGEDAAIPKAPEGKEVKALGKVYWPNGWQAEAPAQQWIIRTYNELIPPGLAAPEHVLEEMRKANAAKYAKALKVAAIDFQKTMIVGVSGGVQPTSGYGVEMVKVEKTPNGPGLTVFWKLRTPALVEAVLPMPMHPAAVALVPQHAGKVTFQQVKS
jgi:hypothetical protein